VALDRREIISVRVQAERRDNIVEALQDVVAVIGDGNDALALKSPHVGTAMGIAGTRPSRKKPPLFVFAG
jgi:magnesium-transporting ATPase (P-type)